MSWENVEEVDQRVDVFAALKSQQYILLTTYRKNGDSMPTIVWFAYEEDRLYVMTIGNAGKIKRIRNNPRVTLAPCNSRGKMLGDSLEGHARELVASDFAHVRNLLTQKYRVLYRLFMLLFKVRKVQPTYIVIEPV